MVNKNDIRALIDAVKEDDELSRGSGFVKSHVLGMINYYLGGVTKKDLDEVRGK